MNYFRDDIIDRLKKLDLEASLLFEGERRLQCVVVGGSAIVLKQYVDRSTHDIDLLRISDELAPLLEKYDMNTNVAAHLDCFPESYPQRVSRVEGLSTRKIDYFVPALEDLVISKLAAHREQDLIDINEPAILKALDWNLLDKVADEITEGFISDRLVQNFVSIFEEYKELKRP